MRKLALSAVALLVGVSAPAMAATNFTPTMTEAVLIENRSFYQLQGNKLIDVFYDFKAQCTVFIDDNLDVKLPKTPVNWYAKLSAPDRMVFPGTDSESIKVLVNGAVVPGAFEYGLADNPGPFPGPWPGNTIRIHNTRGVCFPGDTVDVLLHLQYVFK